MKMTVLLVGIFIFSASLNLYSDGISLFSTRDVNSFEFLEKASELGNQRVGVLNHSVSLKAHPYRKSETLMELDSEDEIIFVKYPKRGESWAKIDVDGIKGWIKSSAADWMSATDVKEMATKGCDYRKYIVNETTRRAWSDLSSKLKDYYKEAEGKDGAELFDILHRISGRNYKTFQYGTAKAYMYANIDNRKGKVYTYYSGLWLAKQGRRYLEVGDGNKDGYQRDFVNCEHTWPQSMFLKKTPMVSDIHHLVSTLSIPNGRRSHFPFGYVDGEDSYHTGSVDGRPGSRLGDHIFEPTDKQKGNTARAMLYFYTRYYDKNIRSKSFSEKEFWDSRVPIFLQWSREDAPDKFEKERNNAVEKFQGNRNPYIDFPRFADLITVKVFQKK